MFETNLTAFAKVRISRAPRLGEMSTQKPIERVIGADRTSRPESFVSLEAFVPRGAMAEYGLLGIRYAPVASDDLKVRAGVLAASVARWDGSLANRTDDVRLGLPGEYVSFVSDGLLECQVTSPGELSVIEAAHGAVGSSGRFFKRVALAAALILWMSDGELESAATVASLRQVLVG
jgi:hypothetical protein